MSKTKTVGLTVGPVFVTFWLVGIVVSTGFWHTLASVIIPFVGPITGLAWLIDIIEKSVGA